MLKIVIYSTKICPYCRNAKQLLTQKGVSYEEILVDEDPAKLEEMMTRSGRRTVPQIFINGQSIGGFDDLSALNASGELDNLLKGGTTHD